MILYWFIIKSIAVTQYDMFCTHSIVLPAKEFNYEENLLKTDTKPYFWGQILKHS